MKIREYVERHRLWSSATFGPGEKTSGVVEHIRRELKEVERDPSDIMEWIDVMILAIDGCWRMGWTPEEIEAALVKKQKINGDREWPPIAEQAEGKPVEHVRVARPRKFFRCPVDG